MDQSNGAGNFGRGASEEEVRHRFKELTESLMVPNRNECMVCFLLRTLPLTDPSGSAMTAVYQKFNAPRAVNLFARLFRMGVYCDGLLLQRGVVANDALWNADCCPDCGIPFVAPDCLEVRLGSTQPCKLWRWRRDVEWEVIDEGLRPYF